MGLREGLVMSPWGTAADRHSCCGITGDPWMIVSPSVYCSLLAADVVVWLSSYRCSGVEIQWSVRCGVLHLLAASAKVHRLVVFASR